MVAENEKQEGIGEERGRRKKENKDEGKGGLGELCTVLFCC